MKNNNVAYITFMHVILRLHASDRNIQHLLQLLNRDHSLDIIISLGAS